MIDRLNKITTEEDVEILTSGPAWEFEYYTKDREEAINNIIKVVNILVDAKLFSRYIEFYHKKMMSDLDEESVARFICANILDDDFTIDIEGDTTVYLPVDSYPGPKRSVDMSNIIKVNASYYSGLESIMIFTNSSIWMPFNCKGRPHIDVYALNLNRLSSALVKIEALGLELINDSHYCDERCIDSGYLLRNYAEECDFRPEDYVEDDDDNGIYGISRADW